MDLELFSDSPADYAPFDNLIGLRRRWFASTGGKLLVLAKLEATPRAEGSLAARTGSSIADIKGAVCRLGLADDRVTVRDKAGIVMVFVRTSFLGLYPFVSEKRIMQALDRWVPAGVHRFVQKLPTELFRG